MSGESLIITRESTSSLGHEFHVTISSVFRRNGLEFSGVELIKIEEPLLFLAL